MLVGPVASPSCRPEPMGLFSWPTWLLKVVLVSVKLQTISQLVNLHANFLFHVLKSLGLCKRHGLRVGSGFTWVGLLQLVPTEEGSFLLLAEIRSLLQEPVGNSTLADTWRKRSGVIFASSVDGM